MGLVGSIIKSFMGSDDDVVDPATGLTMRQKRLLLDSWALMGNRKSQKKYGIALFLALFKAYPEQQEFFPLFKDMSTEELKSSPELRAHATTLMYQISSFIDNLEDPECLVGLLQKVARNHLKRGIGQKEFDELREMFGGFLRDELGSAATPEVVEAWDKVLATLCAVVKQVDEEMSTQKT